MKEQCLPNELVADIVSFLTDHISRYPSLLRVSRWWYKLGYSHLYESVIVDTEETAELFLRTLRLRPDLAHRVKRIRLDGLLGGRSFDILSIIPPDISHLGFSWFMLPGEDVKPFASILTKLKPHRVSLYNCPDRRPTVSSESLELAVSICSCITTHWTTLVSHQHCSTSLAPADY